MAVKLIIKYAIQPDQVQYFLQQIEDAIVDGHSPHYAFLGTEIKGISAKDIAMISRIDQEALGLIRGDD